MSGCCVGAKCACQHTKKSFVFSSTQTHTHTHINRQSCAGLILLVCGDICVVFCALSVVGGARQPDWLGPCTSAFWSGRQYTFGLLLRLGMMAGAEGQKASHASSSHWESRLLQGHLYRRPDWAHWKVGRGEREIKEEGRIGGGRVEGRERGWMTKRCLLSFKPS